MIRKKLLVIFEIVALIVAFNPKLFQEVQIIAIMMKTMKEKIVLRGI